MRAPTSLAIDHFLGVVEAAAALNFASDAGVGFLRRRRPAARGITHFLFGDSVADAHDHACDITLMRSVRKYPYLRIEVLAMNAVGQPTSTMCENSCVVIESIDGGQAAGNRKGTTIRFMAT